MEYRSTNDNGWVHFQGDLVTNVSSGQAINSSHGVRLTGGSTGGVVTAAGDETNIALNVLSKGTGPLNLGSTNSPIFTGGSTCPWLGFVRITDTAVATPNFATTNAMVMETTSALGTTSVTTNSYIVAANGYAVTSPSTDMIIVGAYVSRSTQGDVHCLMAKLSTLTVGASTATITYLIARF